MIEYVLEEEDVMIAIGKRTTKTIAIVSSIPVAGVENEFLLGVAQYAQERRNFVIRLLHPSDSDMHDSLADCDGIISWAMQATERLKTTGLPIIDISNIQPDPDLIGVDVDTARTAVMAAEWFLRRGFRSFAYCGKGVYGFSDTLRDAFAAAVAGCSREYRVYEKGGVEPNPSEESIARLCRELEAWVSTLPPRTAILCMHDIRANYVLQSCLRVGRAVPDDLAIMGRFNDIAICSTAPVTISSIDVNLRGLGYTAMRLIESAVEQPVKPKLRPIFRVRPNGVVERESTAVYPVDPPWLASALMTLDENMDRPVSILDLVSAAGVSRPTLQTAFRKAFGMSAGKYILSVKMREAKRLMEQGRFNVKEIAARTGFATPSYFSKAYHAYYGRAPSSDARRRDEV